jgi:hypothetical protein
MRAAWAGVYTVVALVVSQTFGANYYISPTGQDSRNGLTPGTAWQSVSKLSGVSLAPGDSVLLEGGVTHTLSSSVFFGTTNVSRFSADTAIVLSTYPAASGRATLSVADAGTKAVSVYNVGGIRVEHLVCTGPGAMSSTVAGIEFYVDLGGTTRLRNIQAHDCVVSGFKQGIAVGASAGDDTYSGFRDIRITGCVAHDNRTSGISTWGMWPGQSLNQSHHNLYIGDCVAHTNKGDPNYTSNHSGNGIVVGNVSHAMIEYCEAYNNGELNASTQNNGPVGIWYYETDHGIIQHCVSHNNKSGNGKDGGGFDIDGGCRNCVLQYNYSYDNVGAGYLICQFSGASAFSDDTVRYNVSENDGAANNMGGICWYSAGSNGGIRNVHVYNNTVYNSVACAFRWFNTSGMTDNTIRNNIFITSGGRALVQGNQAIAAGLFQGNSYWASGGAFSVAGYSSLAAWRTATNQEKRGTDTCGISADPRVMSAGAGEPLTDPRALNTLSAYRLLAGSPCIDGGLDLPALFGFTMGTRDYWGNPIPRGQGWDIGAYESDIATPVQYGPRTVPAGSLSRQPRAYLLSGRMVPASAPIAPGVTARNQSTSVAPTASLR